MFKLGKFMNGKSYLRIAICMLFFFILIYGIFFYRYIKFSKGCAPMSIEINIDNGNNKSILNDIDVLRLSYRYKVFKFNKKERGNIWTIDKFFLRKILFVLPDININKIQNINIFFDNKIEYNIQKKQSVRKKRRFPHDNLILRFPDIQLISCHCYT